MSDRKSAEPSLAALSFMLRHPETWPSGFKWKFSSCHKCAMGLASLAWNDRVPTPTPGDMSNAFGLGAGIAMALFTGGYGDDKEVTAEEIADRIDLYLEDEIVYAH